MPHATLIGDHISLFTGLGMMDLAAEEAGFRTAATAEVDPYCQRVLRKRFPEATHYDDVQSVRYETWAPVHTELFTRPLLVTGGFPCQDVASSGTALGLSGARSGLWYEQLRVIQEFQPDYVLAENSSMLTQRGLHLIVHELVSEGYHVRWECLTAATLGAPHLRDRCYVMARKTESDAWERRESGEYLGRTRDLPTRLTRAGLANPDGHVFELVPLDTRRLGRLTGEVLHGSLLPTPTKSDGSGGPGTTPKRTGGKNLRTVAAEHEGSGRLDPTYVEWMMGLPLGWSDADNYRAADQFPAPMAWDDRRAGLLQMTVPNRSVQNRTKRIQALGNGLVPKVAALALDILTED